MHTPPPPVWTRWELLLALILLVGFVALNLYDAATIALWYDEGWTLMEITGVLTREGLTLPVGVPMASDDLLAQVAQPGPFTEVAGSLYVHDTHPPLYFQTLWAWTHLFGTSSLGMRSLSVATITAAALLLTLYTRRIAGPCALLALALFFTSPGGAYSAVNARGYGLALLLVVLALVGMLRAVDGDKPRRWSIIAGAAIGFGSITHYFTILTLVPAGIVALVFLIARRRWTSIGLMALASLPGFAMALFIWLPQQLGARPNQIKGFGELAVEGLSMFRVFTNQFTQLSLQPLWVGIPLVLAGAFLLAAFLRQARHAQGNPTILVPFAGMFGGMVGMFLLFWATDKTLLNFSIPRYGVLTLPSLALLLAQLPPPAWRHSPKMIVASLVLLVAAGLVPRSHWSGFDNPWASAVGADAGHAQLASMPEDAIVVLTTKEPGRVGTTLHDLPSGVTLVYTPTPDDFATWLATVSPQHLYMRPLFWANQGDMRPFPDGFYDAAQAAGYNTDSAYIWSRIGP